MNTSRIASFAVQSTFEQTLKEKIKRFRIIIVASLSIYSVLMLSTLLNQKIPNIPFLEAFVLIFFFCIIFIWGIWTVIFKLILNENKTLYLPFNLDFYEDKIIFREFYQAIPELSKLDKWKLENLAKNIVKQERTIEYLHAHIQSFELTYTDNLFIVIIHIGNTIQRFNLEIENQNYIIAMQKVLSQLYNQKIKIKETNQHNQRTHLLKVINDEQEKEIDPSIQKLINQLGKHKQDE